MLHQSRGNVFGIRLFRHLEIQDLQHRGAAKVETKRLAGSLDVADDLAVFLRDVNQRLLRKGQQRGERRAE